MRRSRGSMLDSFRERWETFVEFFEVGHMARWLQGATVNDSNQSRLCKLFGDWLWQLAGAVRFSGINESFFWFAWQYRHIYESLRNSRPEHKETPSFTRTDNVVERSNSSHRKIHIIIRTWRRVYIIGGGHFSNVELTARDHDLDSTLSG